jgi:hypothetical protein
MMNEQNREHALRVVNWLTTAVWNKYDAGIVKHGGHLPDKGGLLHEAECEVLDQAVYIRTLREQLTRIEKWIEDGNTENALIAIGHILRGSPRDRFPTG